MDLPVGCVLPLLGRDLRRDDPSAASAFWWYSLFSPFHSDHTCLDFGAFSEASFLTGRSRVTWSEPFVGTLMVPVEERGSFSE